MSKGNNSVEFIEQVTPNFLGLCLGGASLPSASNTYWLPIINGLSTKLQTLFPVGDSFSQPPEAGTEGAESYNPLLFGD